METIFFTLAGTIVGVILGGVMLWYFVRNKPRREDTSLLLIQNQLGELTRFLDDKLGQSHRLMHDSVKEQFKESQLLIKEITRELTHVKETGRQVADVRDQIQSLQNVLQNPKQRGVLGEYYLQTVLKNVLPPGRFKMQYAFADGETVDAVIFLDKNRILPIDSKFSLENYNRILEARDSDERERLERAFKQDLKRRIDETAKYIRPKEGTMDFAFMFIPSEAVFYDLLINQVGAVRTSSRDLIEYAYREKRVIIVSPTSFLAYLQTVLQGLRSLEIEDKAQEIIKRVGELGRHIGNYNQYMAKLGGALGTTVSHYNTAHRELKKIDKDVLRIAGESPGIEPLSVDNPTREE